MHYLLKPESCGNFGRKVLYGGELTDRPPTIYRLDYEFTSWPTDDLLETNCTFIATEKLVSEIIALSPRATGVSFDTMAINTTYEMRRERPGEDLPAFKWCKVSGKAGVDDFGLSSEHHLVVSERILRLIQGRLKKCQIAAYKGA